MSFKSFAVTTFFALLTIFSAAVGAAAQEMPAEPASSQTPMPVNAASIKIGVAIPKASFAVEGVDNAQIAAGLREMISGYFKGTSVEVVPLESRLAEPLLDEAIDKGCHFVLQTSVTQKKGGGGFGAFKTVAPVLGSVAPMAGVTGSTAGVIVGSVTQSAIYTAANIASTTKAKDQFTFEYSLIGADDKAVKLTNSMKAKAKTDGEDVLSPMVEKMAEAILKTVE
jgi:hypothetical protein